LWLLLIPGLVACVPTGTSDPDSKWLPSQVRGLDPAESTPNPFAPINPTQDLIALYSRETSSALQIRLDLLDLELNSVAGLPLNPVTDIYIAIDFLAGDPSQDCDLLISIPAQGLPEAKYFQQPNLQIMPVVQFDLLQDSLILSIDRAILPDLRPGYSLRATLTMPGSQQILDEIPTVWSTATAEPLPLVFAFWNTFPAHTPAQVLRRWDGAHTGPLGERHGLKHLLEASQMMQVPIVLLDLKTPSSLVALDLLGQMQNIANLNRSGLLILPDSLPETFFGDLPAWANQRAAKYSRQTALNFGLTGSPFLYAPSMPIDPISNYNLIFVRSADPNKRDESTTRNTLSQGQRFISIPIDGTEAQPATAQGLTIEIRRRMLQIALDHRNETEIAVLGGDLSHSTFGNPQAAQATMRYIAGHPWIQVMKASELYTLPGCSNCVTPNSEKAKTFDHPVLDLLQNAPPSPISDLAWQMFLDLSAPATPFSSELVDLRTSYLGEIGNLLIAADWEARRDSANKKTTMRSQVQINCEVDTDYDGRGECQLANEDYFAILDPDGGRLSLLFAGSTQLVGASSQFVVGLSDHQEWDIGAGPIADPANIPGALAGPWSSYDLEQLPDGVRQSSAGVEKIFRMGDNGLHIDLNVDQPLPFQVPLVVAPQSRFNAGWTGQYEKSEIPQGWIWGIRDGAKAEIRVSGVVTSYTSLDSKALLLLPENPNMGYPAGHFLPFPLAVVDLPQQSTVWLEISLFSGQPLDQ